MCEGEELQQQVVLAMTSQTQVTEAMPSLAQVTQSPAMLGQTRRPLATGSQAVSGRAKAARWEPGQRRPAQALGRARWTLGRARRPHAGPQRAWLPRARQ